MRVNHKLALAMGAALAAVVPGAALAQDGVVGLGRGEVEQHYDEALAMTLDPGVIAANDTRFIWASQAKAQCGIAIGFFKSGYADPVSTGKCDAAWSRMRGITATPMAPAFEVPPAPPPPPVPPPPPPPSLRAGERG